MSNQKQGAGGETETDRVVVEDLPTAGEELDAEQAGEVRGGAANTIGGALQGDALFNRVGNTVGGALQGDALLGKANTVGGGLRSD